MSDLIPTLEGDSPEMKRHTFAALIAYIFFLLPMLTSGRNDPFVIYHEKQSFILFLFIIFARVIVLGFFDLYLLSTLLQTAIFILWCFGITYVFLGKTKPIPILGKLAEKLPF